MPRLGHCPIVRYPVGYTVELLRAGNVKLLKLRDGHAEVLGGKSADEALGWLSRAQVERVEQRSEQRRENHMSQSTPETSRLTGDPAVCSTDLLCSRPHVVNTSGGICSFWAADRTVKKQGRENVTLLFADVLMED